MNGARTIVLSRIAASASPVEGAILGAGSSPLLNYVCFDVCFDVFIFLFFFICTSCTIIIINISETVQDRDVVRTTNH